MNQLLSNSNLRLGLADERDDFRGRVCREQRFAQFWVPQNPAQSRQHGKVLRDGWRDQEEKQLRGHAVNRRIRNSLVVPPEHHDGLVHEADERVAGVRQRDAIADAGAVQLLALLQRAQESLARFGPARNLLDLVHQLAQHRVTVLAGKVKLNGFGREHLAQARAFGRVVCHIGRIVNGGRG